MEERYLALSDIAWNTQHRLCSLSLVVTEQDIQTHQQLKKKKKKSQIKHKIIIILIINKNKLKVVDCSLEIHGLFQIWLPTKAGIFFTSLHRKTTCGFRSVQCCGLHLLAFWVSLNVEVSTFPKWHVWMFGPFCDGCQMLECAMFRSYCKSFLPSMKKEKFSFIVFFFIPCAIINTHHKP